MKNDKILTGMAHLFNEANPQAQGKDSGPEFPKNKCTKVRCILEGVDYYVPGNNVGIMTEEPLCPWFFPLGYSAVSGPGAANFEPVAIIRHTEKRFFQTGVSTEIVDLPKWWENRDSY